MSLVYNFWLTMGFALLASRLVLAMVFAVAGAAKVLDRAGTQKAVADFGLPPLLAKPVGILLPIAELAIAVLLLSTNFASWGAAGALVLLLAFISVIAVNLANGRTPECHCFGQIRSTPIGRAVLIRNVALALAAAAILWKGPGVSTFTAANWLAAIARARPTALTAVSLLMTALAVQTILVIALFRQHGRLLLRMDRFEQALGDSGSFAPSPSMLPGLPIGAPAPSFESLSASSRIRLETLLAHAEAALLVFSDPDCQACRELLPDIERWQREQAEQMTFVLVSRAFSVANDDLGRRYHLPTIALQKEHEISEAYRIGAIPAAVVVRADGTIGSRVATGRAAIASLVTSYSRSLTTAKEAVV